MSRLAETAELVAINSVSGMESELATLVAGRLALNPALEITRIGDNVVARTTFGKQRRVIVAGHLDTVPGNPSDALLEGNTLTGLGAVDMKGSIAVMLHLATTHQSSSHDLTWVFYAREEIARDQSGLLEIHRERPDLLQGDIAILGEPTDGDLEAGCQGTLRLEVEITGQRAHTARPFTGVNAIHRLGRVIDAVAGFVPRHVTLDGVDFVEQMQVVFASGGVANNVVPDRATCTINYRVAPDRTLADAEEAIRTFLGSVLSQGDSVRTLDWAPSCPPDLSQPALADLSRVVGTVRAKVGWTDVATFREWGLPAINFGVGDPLLAHRSDEFVTAEQLDDYEAKLRAYLS